jgi:L-glutamine-phosphate cytidylyltransferase
MDALIMAAGRGSRLGAETDGRPKALVDLGGITPLEFQIGVLAARGVRTAVVVTGYRRGAVEDVLAGLSNKINVVTLWNPFWPVSNVIGSAWFARRELEDDFVYLHADTMFDPSILDDLLQAEGDAVLPIDYRPCEAEQMKAEVVDGRVRSLSKDLPTDRTAGEFIGIAFFRRAAVAQIRASIEAVVERGDLGSYFEAAINHAITAGTDVRALATDRRPWTEIDFEEDLVLARQLLPRLVSRATDGPAPTVPQGTAPEVANPTQS